MFFLDYDTSFKHKLCLIYLVPKHSIFSKFVMDENYFTAISNHFSSGEIVSCSAIKLHFQQNSQYFVFFSAKTVASKVNIDFKRYRMTRDFHDLNSNVSDWLGVSQAPNWLELDPALTDPELQAKLKANDEIRKKRFNEVRVQYFGCYKVQYLVKNVEKKCRP